MKKNNIIEIVTEIFNEYLVTNKYRKTPERYAILNAIYKFDGHFDVESMYIHMKNKNYRVSRATLYNTMEILLKCQLIRKHQFEKAQAQYEKSYSNKQHDHLICTKCNRVIEFCDPRIQSIKTVIAKSMHFNINRHSLNLYGTCQGCQEKIIN